MQTNLQNKIAIITGASSGIGEMSAKMLAAEGASVMISARREDALFRVQREIRQAGGVCEIYPGDLSSDGFCAQLVEKTVEVFGGVDILVCNAGMALRKPTLEMPVEEWNRLMHVNPPAPLLLSQAAIRRMKEQGRGGKIVFISSTAGKNVNMGASPSYGASKAGLLYLTRHLATEFAKDHIYVNAICPGPVDTEITSTWTPEHRAKVMSNLPMGRLGQPEDIANMVVFLSSSLSDFITGESVLVNGGRFME